MLFKELCKLTAKPNLYAPSTNKFWDNEHISKGMLEAHLDPNWDAATRKPEFLDKSVNWISRIAPPPQHRLLLDLGCGPGLYAERFSRAGYSVTGLDFSKRSIAYAKEQTLLNQSNIEYDYRDYLTLDYEDQFDVVTLIYCDYPVFSVTDRQILLKKIYRALKPNGKFIFDVFTPRMRKDECRSWFSSDGGDFFSEKRHIVLDSVYQYDDDDHTELRQSIVITEDRVDCYNIWDHFFTKDALISEVLPAGFKAFEIFGNIAGEEFSESGETICGVFTK